jgi:hypothetical protein
MVDCHLQVKGNQKLPRALDFSLAYDQLHERRSFPRP